jgi:catechol 2,3-dioxygenase-like lactoylglutathione lyase family enzyme
VFTDIYHVGDLTEDYAAAIDFYSTYFGAELLSQATYGDGKTKRSVPRRRQLTTKAEQPRLFPEIAV